MVLGKTASQVTSISVPSLASGGRFGEPNASRSDALIFWLLFPRNNLLLKNNVTSGIIKCPAMTNAPIKLLRPSFLCSNIGI